VVAAKEGLNGGDAASCILRLPRYVDVGRLGLLKGQTNELASTLEGGPIIEFVGRGALGHEVILTVKQAGRIAQRFSREAWRGGSVSGAVL
jgi:hypothetical protein